MDYYQKYLELLNSNKSIIGGSIEPSDKKKFYSENSYMHYPYSWNAQNNQLYRWPLIMKLIKLPPDTIKEIIGKSADNIKDYQNFLNCILVSIDNIKENGVNINTLLRKYDTEYNDHLSKLYNHLDLNIKTGSNVVHVKNLIDYFIDTHRKITDRLTLSPSQDEDIAKELSEHLSLCRDFYYSWRQRINKFYGLEEFNGLTVRTDSTGRPDPDDVRKEANKTKSIGLFKILHSDKRKQIDAAYKILNESSIISYLKIRCEGEKYNQRFNVYLEPNKDDSNKPQSMYLTGPNPNNRLSFYKAYNPGELGVLSDPAVAAENPNLIPDEQGNVKDIKKYDYGILYGPFTKIFKPKESNTDIARKCTEVIKTLQEDRSIFILGYGASGAGKTTALIYNKMADDKKDKDGILLQILKSKEFDEYDSIDVSIHELYSKSESGETQIRKYDDIKFRKDRTDPKNPIFYLSGSNDGKKGTYDENVRTDRDKAEIDTDIAAVKKAIADSKGIINEPTGRGMLNAIPNLKWINTKYKWEIKNDGGKTYFTSANSKDDNKGPEFANVTEIYDPRMLCKTLYKDYDLPEDQREKLPDDRQESTIYGVPAGKPIRITELGDFILTLVDRIRMINPTTNNPISSRSHVLIYIKLPQKRDSSKFKYLIVGDLAGVENKFTCEEEDTQVQFLTLKKINRITGKKEGEEPHYTVNTKLRFYEFPNTPDVNNVLEYLQYDPKTRKKGDEFSNRMKDLERASGRFLFFETQELIDQVKADLPLGNNSEVDRINREISDLQRDKQSKESTITLIQKLNASWFIDVSTIRDWKVQTVSSQVAGVRKVYDVAKLINPSKYKLNSADPFEFKDALPNTTPTAQRINREANVQNVVEAIQEVKTLYDNKEQFQRDISSIDQRISQKRAELATKEQTGDSAIAIKVKKRIQKLELPRDREYMFIENTDYTGFNYFKKFYQEKVKKNGLNSKFIVDGTEFNNLVFNDKVREKSQLKPGELELGILQIIRDNDKILEQSGVKELCTERMSEGIYINEALIGMSQNISNIIQGLNSSKDPGLFKNIPLVKEPCFKYYCNQDHQSCFSQVKKDGLKVNTSIVGDIRDVIGENGVNSLGIAVFAVLNINRYDAAGKTVNDPPRMLYMDINKLKNIRDEYLTYNFYNQGNSEDIKTRLKGEIDREFIGTGTINSPADGSIKKNLDNYKSSLGEKSKLYLDPIERYKEIDSKKNNFFTKLVELINAIEIVNSLSVIGTMNFLNSIKNIFSTDKTCNLLMNDNPDDPLLDKSIEEYENVIGGEPLITQLLFQKNSNAQNMVKVKENALDIAPATINRKQLPALPLTPQSPPGGLQRRASSPALVKTPVKASSQAPVLAPVQARAQAPVKAKGLFSIDSILGGYIDNSASHGKTKEDLKNEYKQLKKMYKKIKNNVI